MADGCYVPKYYSASFKGVEFPCEEAGSEHGRRGAEGEFPFGENTGYADLGRRIRHYHLKARYATNDHLERARELIAACESIGPGTLVHPHLGAVRAACKKVKVTNHVTTDQGYTDLDLEMVEANDWLGTAVGATLSALGVGGIVSAVGSMFAGSFNLDVVPIFEVAAAVSTAQEAVAQIKTAFQSSVGLNGDKSVWRISADLDTVATRGESVSRTTTAWQAISNGIAAIEVYGTSTATKTAAYTSLINWASRGAALTGYGGAAQEAVFQSVRILGAAYLARVGATAVATSSQQACSQYSRVLRVLNEEAEIARSRCDDVLYVTLRNFIVEAQTSLLARIFDAPAIVEYNFNGGVTSIVAAHEIYGDAKRFAEIEASNPGQLSFLVGPLVRAIAPKSASL